MEDKEVPDVKTEIPGPRSKQSIKDYMQLFGNLGTPYTAIEKGIGCIKIDIDGNRFLDFSQSLCIVGFSNNTILDASIDQIKKMIPREKGAGILLEFTKKIIEKIERPKEVLRVNYLTSGSEAIELSAHMVREYTKKPIILSYYDSHHGHIGIPFQLSGDPSIDIWRKDISNVIHIPYPTCYRCPFGLIIEECGLQCIQLLESLLETIAQPSQVAGLLMEPILLNGGVFIPPKKYLDAINSICKENNILLIADEIYTGLGYSGSFLAFNHWDIKPDVICLGKALGGGFPISAVVTKKEITDLTRGGVIFTSTYSGNLVACAAGLATINYIYDNNLLENSIYLGNLMKKGLREISEDNEIIGDVRGEGLILGIDLVKDLKTKKPAQKEAEEIIKNAFKNGLILRRYGRYKNVLIMTPPITLTKEQAEKGIEIFEKVISQI